MLNTEDTIDKMATGCQTTKTNVYTHGPQTTLHYALSVSYDRGSSLGMFKQRTCDNSVLPDVDLINVVLSPPIRRNTFKILNTLY